MKKIPIVFICGVGLGILLLSAFGESSNTAKSPAQAHAATSQDNLQTTTASINAEPVNPTVPNADITPAVVNTSTQVITENGIVNPEEAAAPEEPKVWCERHPERCKHIHERKAKLEMKRIETLQALCEKQPHDKQCDELKEIANAPDKQDEVTKVSGSAEKQLEKHLEEHR